MKGKPAPKTKMTLSSKKSSSSINTRLIISNALVVLLAIILCFVLISNKKKGKDSSAVVEAVSNTDGKTEVSTVVSSEEIFADENKSSDAAGLSEAFQITEAPSSDKFIADLSDFTGKDLAKKVYDIIINKIRFDKVDFIHNSESGNSCQIVLNDEYVATLEIKGNDIKVYIPEEKYIFYENGEVLNMASTYIGSILTEEDIMEVTMIAQKCLRSSMMLPDMFEGFINPPTLQRSDDLVVVGGSYLYYDENGVETKGEYYVQLRFHGDFSEYDYESVYFYVDGEESGNLIFMDMSNFIK